VIYKNSENRNFRIILTEDGSHTVYYPLINDHYHSIHGAFSESLHVYIRSGFSYHPSVNVSILEVGFGTGLNVLLTLKTAFDEKRQVTYHTVDKFALPADITDHLNYSQFTEIIIPGLFNTIHRLSWDTDHDLSGFFSLRKILADISNLELTGGYDVVYFDAFGPDKQPDMWTEDIFRKIYNAMNPGGLLVTYSSKGDVKRKFQHCGFIVEKIPGPPRKREMLRCLRQP
jgi:tRNA U34 5-methylaminomethyl-2-thiouridine-forming methyltransferase MnmC